MEIRKINCMSDFDAIMRLSDCKGNETGWPECDWRAEFFTSSGVGIYRASCIGGECRNCFNDGGRIHVVFKDHRMGVGTLQCRLTLDLPDGVYPDGIRRDVSPAPLGVELVNGAGDCPSDITLDLTLPAVYLTAYDLAVRAGYAGTLAEYIGCVNRFPQVVETSEMLGRMLSDLDDGKARIADALTRQGEPTDRSEPMAAMADKVLGLRLAVPGEPGVIDQSGGGRLEHTDLLNLLRNSVRAATPYCYGVRHALNSVTLMGADAYLCSDGFFTEAGGVHEFTGGGDRWIIYYFRKADYMVTAPSPCIEIVALNGRPQFELSAVTVPTVRSYTEEKYTLAAASGYAFGATAEISLAGVQTLRRTVCSSPSLLSLSLPDLENASTQIFYSVTSLRRISLPLLKKTGGLGLYHATALTDVDLPSLESLLNGYCICECSALLRLELPSLRDIQGGILCQNNKVLAEISLPALEVITGGTIAYVAPKLEKLHVPSLKSIALTESSDLLHSAPVLEEVEFPALCNVDFSKGAVAFARSCVKFRKIRLPMLDNMGGGARTSGVFDTGSTVPLFTVEAPVCRSLSCSFAGAAGQTVEILLGSGITSFWTTFTNKATILRLSIGEGARTLIDTNINGNAPVLWDEESLHETLQRLGDNSGAATLDIKIGAAMIALLSEEEIASVTARNYSLS